MKSNAIKWLYSVTKQKIKYIIILIFLQILNGASGVLYALFLRNIVDSASNYNAANFWKNVFFIVFLLLFQIILRATIRWLSEYSKATFENIFKSRLMEKILYKDFASVNSVHSAEWVNRLTNDTVVVSDNYVEILPGITGMVIKIISAIIMMIILDYRFVCILLPFGFLLILITYIFRKKLKKLHKNVQEKDGKLRIFWQEHISNMIIIRSFVAEKQILKETKIKMEEHKKARMKKNYFSNFCNTGFILAMNGMYIFGICYCGYGILIGTITFGTLTAIAQLISQIQSPFANITGYLPKFYAMIASIERLMDIEKFEDDGDKNIFDINSIKKYYSKEFFSFGLRNGSFRYYQTIDDIKNLSKENMPMVIKNFNIEIKKGEYVAFTGYSGCGKSTLLKLLMCIYNLDEGSRFLKNINNQEEKLTIKWRKLFAYVPQGNGLLSGTIREIVAFSNKLNINNDNLINKALKIACADEFVSKLDNGIDTLLGERGEGLSEGQMQRIAIARAIFSESPILLLDEVTSSLDEKTEKKLLQNLRNMTQKTVILITHRPSALEICDRVIDFSDNGDNCTSPFGYL